MKTGNVSKVDTRLHRVVTENPRKRKHGKRDAETMPHFSPIRVYVLRFDPMRAAGLQALFEENSGIEIVLENGSDEVGSGWLDPTIHIVVVGTHLGPGTHKLIATIRSARPEAPILVMSPAAGDEAILSVLGLGAKGFLHEGITPEQFEEAIRTVAAGSMWAPRRLQSELIHRLLTARDTHRSFANANFTGREQQVLDLLLDGQSNREIARSLNIEERTVKSYVTKLLRKMSVKNRTALSMAAMSSKVVSSPMP